MDRWTWMRISAQSRSADLFGLLIPSPASMRSPTHFGAPHRSHIQEWVSLQAGACKRKPSSMEIRTLNLQKKTSYGSVEHLELRDRFCPRDFLPGIEDSQGFWVRVPGKVPIAVSQTDVVSALLEGTLVLSVKTPLGTIERHSCSVETQNYAVQFHLCEKSIYTRVNKYTYAYTCYALKIFQGPEWYCRIRKEGKHFYFQYTPLCIPCFNSVYNL